VAGSGVVKQALLQIHEEISGGDEVLFELAAERTVKPSERARDRGREPLGREATFEHGGDQRQPARRVRDVGDQNTDALFSTQRKS